MFNIQQLVCWGELLKTVKDLSGAVLRGIRLSPSVTVGAKPERGT